MGGWTPRHRSCTSLLLLCSFAEENNLLLWTSYGERWEEVTFLTSNSDTSSAERFTVSSAVAYILKHKCSV